jgi:hypothetical protein
MCCIYRKQERENPRPQCADRGGNPSRVAAVHLVDPRKRRCTTLCGSDCAVYDWMHPIKMFLENQAPSDNNAEVECIVHKSKQYHLVDGILFQQGANGMMMKCISREEGIQQLQDIPSGTCRLHSS